MFLILFRTHTKVITQPFGSHICTREFLSRFPNCYFFSLSLVTNPSRRNLEMFFLLVFFPVLDTHLASLPLPPQPFVRDPRNDGHGTMKQGVKHERKRRVNL